MRGYDYYELLGVSRTASPAEIRSAYRSLAKVMHPDTGGTAGTFRMLREAYETLTDPERRHDYDTGEDGPVAPPVRAWRRDDTDHVPVLPRIDPDTIPWWNEVRGGERVALVPSARPARVVLLAAAGCWTLVFLALAITGAPGSVLVGWLLVLAGVGGVGARHLLAARREDRAFVAEFGSRAVFGSPGTEPDEIAERLTGDLLARYLTRIPAVRVFHGLAAEAGSVFADVHHAVLCGRRLVLVESKLWLPGHYHVDDTGVLWRNGHRFRGGASALPERLAAYRALLPDLEVRGVLLLYPSRAGAITVGDGLAEVAPMDPARFVREVGGWLAADPSTVDREAFRTVAGQVVSS